jgi:plasmid maintenance system antidote protein VapI
MKLSEYISTATEFARKHDFPIPVITRFLNGQRGLSAETMEKIVAATGGQVTFQDLLDEKRDIQAARKKRNGSDQDCAACPDGA